MHPDKSHSSMWPSAKRKRKGGNGLHFLYQK